MEHREDAPHRTYFRACVGSWRGAFELEVTDEAALRDAPLSLADRLRLAMLRLSARVAGPARFETTVRMQSHDVVVHTTRVRALGMPGFLSREVLTLEPDGHRVSLTLTQRVFPLFWPAQTLGPLPATVDATATRAEYELRFLGCALRQRTERDGDLVVLSQETSWSRARVELRRYKR